MCMSEATQPVSGRNACAGAETAARRLGPCVDGVREFLGNRFVYLVFSPRAGGLTVGINLNPDRCCNFDCIYCEVNRGRVVPVPQFDVDVMAEELSQVLGQFHAGQLRSRLPWLDGVPSELLQLRHVALSGEGEPTLCPRFAEVVQHVVHIRARGQFPFFKIVVFSNGSLLNEPRVQSGLRFLIQKDELWLKLDCGTAESFRQVNRPQGVTFGAVVANILAVGRQRPIVIQSLFPMLNGAEPTAADVGAYAAQLVKLRDGGARIAQVQIYSATRPTARSECRHLPLKSLSRIARQVRVTTGLPVQVS